MLITCPSGLSGEIRKYKVREENMLADAKKARSGNVLTDVLSSIWTKTVDPGPYELVDGKVDWSKVLMGDHLFTTVQMRMMTKGSVYLFRPQCSACRHKFDWEVELGKLPVQRLSDESSRIFTSGNRFETTLGDTKIWFKLLQADAQERYLVNRKEYPKEQASAALLMQILEVEGVNKAQLSGWVVNLDSDLADELRASFDEVGCGIETEIEVECPVCDNIDEIDLPFDPRRYFAPLRKKKRKETEVSATGFSET